MNSSSSLGTTQITIQFDLGRDIDGASLDVQTALAVAQRRLPVEMTTPPFFRKVNPGDFRSSSSACAPAPLRCRRSTNMPRRCWRRPCRQLPGVAQVLVYGAQKFAVRVQVDPRAAAARNISLDEIRTVVAKANSSAPVGTLQGPQQSVTLLATGAMEKASAYRDVVVAYRNGAPIRLSEVANVIDSVENNKIATWFNDSRAIVLAVQRQPTPTPSRLWTWCAPRSRRCGRRSAGIEMQTLFDRSLSIRAAVFDVQETLAIAISLVIMVIFLFLRKVSATIIPALAVPISLIGTCAAMYAFGFSINNMTLLALTLSVGFVVDDAIVMLENIVRHIEGGMRAVRGGAERLARDRLHDHIDHLLADRGVHPGAADGRHGRPRVPRIRGVDHGRHHVSGFVSLTLTPMLCARVLKSHQPGEKQNFVLRAFERMFEVWLRAYEWSLDRVLRAKSIMLMVTLATIAGTIWLYIVVRRASSRPKTPAS